MASREHLSRALWTLFEPIHAVSYFSRQAREAFAGVGLTRYWDGYFAGRSAPLGPVGGAPVTAIFSGFAPALVERALPSAWASASVEQVLEARSLGAAATLRDLVSDESAVAAAAEALATAANDIDTIGRPLAAANRALPDESNPYRRLWQATATLREHRGDGHVIALVAGGIAGLSTIVLRSAIDLDAEGMKKARGWTNDEWDAEVRRLVERELLRPDGTITAAATDALRTAEHLTNRLAIGPWAQLDDDELRQVATLLRPIAGACTPLYPRPNPIGMPEPWDAATDPEARSVPALPA